jgi:flagellin
MASILTNASALTALRNLANTQSALSKTQSQISTGLKVGSAGDNTTNWSVSTQMKTDNSVVSTIKDTLKQNSDLVNTASSAIDGLLDTVEKIKIELAKAKDVKDGDYSSINESLTGLKAALNGIVDNAALNGVNLLDDSVADMDTVATDKQITMVSGWASDGAALGKFKTISVTLTDVKTEVATAMGAAGAAVAVSATNVDATADDVEDLLGALRDYSVELGAAKNQIDAQSKFLGVLSESITNSVSTLVDADMNEASTRLQALQTQQQLGVQSLSIANQNSQMILKLFG